MNMHKKRIARRGAAFVCAFGVALSAMPVHAAEVKSLEDKTSVSNAGACSGGQKPRR